MSVAALKTDRADTSFDATCRSRLLTGSAGTLAGMATVVVLGRRLGAGVRDPAP